MLPLRNTCELHLSAQAPAKLIISGEHSVLYGQPALAVAINRYTTTTTSWRNSQKIHFKLLDLAYAKSFTSGTLRRLADNLRTDYTNFLNGKSSIRDVLKRPFELLQYSVSNILDYLNLQLPHGVEIKVDSTIPIGCGMGSSAAAVLSTVYALTNFLQLNWQRADYLTFSREIENLQHGKSSGLDLHLVNYGGCVRFQNGATQARPIPNLPLRIINTGKPLSSTGECVTQVSQAFANDPLLAARFGNVTNLIDAALAANDINAFKAGIKENHRLLTQIGVVPEKVGEFIRDLESIGAAAKICGAGSIAGDNAGVVLLIADSNLAEQELDAVMQQYNYSVQNIQVDSYGTRVI